MAARSVGASLVMVGGLAMIGCDGSVANMGEYASRDSAGITIVESTQPVWGTEPEWSVSATPFLEIGTLDGDERLQFAGITGLARMSDGRIAVLNSSTSTIRFFNEDGTPSGELGGRGDGPGEFRSLGSIRALEGGGALVWDGARRTLSEVSDAGEFVTSTALNLPPAQQQLTRVLVRDDRRLVVQTYAVATPSSSDQEAAILRGKAPILLFSADGLSHDTLGVFPSAETIVMSVAGQNLMGAPPFPRSAHVALRANEVIIGSADKAEIQVLDAAGELSRVVRYGELRAVSEEDREWYRQQLAQMASTPQEQQMTEMLLAALVFPDAHPAYSGIVTDPTGPMWLRTGRHFPPSAISTEWTVLSPEGALLGTLVLPEGFDLHEVGESYLLGVWRDQFGIEFIRLYELSRGG